MGVFNNLVGNADVKESSQMLEKFLATNEQIFLIVKTFRDEIAFTSKGIYKIDAQGMTGKKKEVLFVGKDEVTGVKFETAGHLDFDTEMEVKTKYSGTIEIQLKKGDSELLQQIFILIKNEYLK